MSLFISHSRTYFQAHTHTYSQRVLTNLERKSLALQLICSQSDGSPIKVQSSGVRSLCLHNALLRVRRMEGNKARKNERMKWLNRNTCFTPSCVLMYLVWFHIGYTLVITADLAALPSCGKIWALQTLTFTLWVMGPYLCEAPLNVPANVLIRPTACMHHLRFVPGQLIVLGYLPICPVPYRLTSLSAIKRIRHYTKCYFTGPSHSCKRDLNLKNKGIVK